VVVFTALKKNVSVATRVATETNGKNYGGDVSSFFSILSKSEYWLRIPSRYTAIAVMGGQEERIQVARKQFYIKLLT